MSATTALSDLMDFGHTVYSTGLGVEHPSVSDHGYMHSPTVEEIQYVDLDADGGALWSATWRAWRRAGRPDPVAPDGWEYLTGFTGQYSYSGPVMHRSECIDGRLADHILSTPGYYVAVAIDAWPFVDEGANEHAGDVVETESVGWGILHYVGDAS